MCAEGFVNFGSLIEIKSPATSNIWVRAFVHSSGYNYISPSSKISHGLLILNRRKEKHRECDGEFHICDI